MDETRAAQTFNDHEGDGYQRAIGVLDSLCMRIFEFEGALPESLETRRADQLAVMCGNFLDELEKMASRMGLKCWPRKT